MFLGMAMIYATVLVSSLIFVWYQTNTSNRWDETHATHEDYALRMSGLPADACDPSEITDFFTSALEAALALEPRLERTRSFHHLPKIVGVSIAYDYKEHEDFIEECIDDWITELEIEVGRRDWKHRPHHLDEQALDTG